MVSFGSQLQTKHKLEASRDMTTMAETGMEEFRNRVKAKRAATVGSTNGSW